MTGPLWLAVALIGAVTLAARLLPLLWRGGTDDGAAPPAWLDALGPCLLTAMAVAVLLPEALTAAPAGGGLSFPGGLAAAAGVMGLRRDPGLAAVAGVLGWWLAGAL